MKKLTKEQTQLIEEAKYGVATGIYDNTDLEYYAKKLNMKLNEVQSLVGIGALNKPETKPVPTINELDDVTHENMREATQQLLKGGNSKQLYEKWVQEGYLNEASCSPDMVAEMMKDNDICEEMYESCMNMVNECGGKDSWMKTRAGANGKVFEAEDMDNDELPVPIEDEPEGHELGDENEENPEDVIKLDIPLLIRLLEFSKENAETDVDLHKLAEHLIEMQGDDPDRVLSIDDYEDILQDLADLDPGDMPADEPEVEPEPEDIEDFEPDDEDENEEPKPMFESELAKFTPVMGSNIGAENKQAEKKALDTTVADVEQQSETEEEKVENLRNQKHEVEKSDQELTYKMKGKTPADVNLDTENPQYEERIEKEMKTGDSRDRDESVVGGKAGIGDAKVYTEKPNGTSVADSVNGGEEEFKKYKERKKVDAYTSIPLNVKHRKGEQSININEAEEKINRIKQLINFDGGKLNNPVNKINEDIDFMSVYHKFKDKNK